MRDKDLKVFSEEVKKGFVEALGDKSSFKRKKIKSLKLKANTALFWGSDCEDVKIIEDIDKDMFDKVWDLDEDKVAFLAGDNDGDMFDILFSMDDECAYDLIEDYDKEWGRFIEIITE